MTPQFFFHETTSFYVFGALLPAPQAKIFDSPLSEYIGKCISEVGECPAKRGVVARSVFYEDGPACSASSAP